MTGSLVFGKHPHNALPAARLLSLVHSYLFVYIFLLKNLAVYALDIYTATTMIASSTWTNVIYRKCGNDCAIKIPFDIAKWVFVGCIAFGFLLVSPDES